MTSEPAPKALSLFDAARAKGVPFTREAYPEDKYLEANGLRFHYLDWGEPAKPAILLLHGFAQTCHSWDFVCLSLCDRFRLIALDQRGHGDSQWAPNGDYSSEAHDRDIEAVVDSLGLDNFVLGGLSMGGRNALAYAANHASRLKALVIVDFAPVMGSKGSEHIRRFIEDDDELDSVEAFVDRVQKFNPRRSVEQIRGSLMHNIKQLPNGKWTWKYDGILRKPGRRPARDPKETQRLWGYVDSVSSPTLVVRGAKSNVVAADTAHAVRDRLAVSTLAVVEDAGHLVPGDNPAGFIAALTTFLNDLP